MLTQSIYSPLDSRPGDKIATMCSHLDLSCPICIGSVIYLKAFAEFDPHLIVNFVLEVSVISTATTIMQRTVPPISLLEVYQQGRSYTFTIFLSQFRNKVQFIRQFLSRSLLLHNSHRISSITFPQRPKKPIPTPSSIHTSLHPPRINQSQQPRLLKRLSFHHLC
jgi:hypothetical protein